jgi:hypothetical protein
MSKKGQLIRLLHDHFQYPEEEITHILNHIQPEWYTFQQTDLEIVQQLHREYSLWRGFGTAIFNYLQHEKEA